MKPTRLFMVHGDAHICILTYYFKNEMLGAQKTHAREKNIIYFVSCNKKENCFAVFNFFFYFIVVLFSSLV